MELDVGGMRDYWIFMCRENWPIKTFAYWHWCTDCRYPAFSITTLRKTLLQCIFTLVLKTFTKFIFVLSTLGPAAYFLYYAAHHTVSNVQFFCLNTVKKTYNFELSRMFEIAENVISNIFLTWVSLIKKTMEWTQYLAKSKTCKIVLTIKFPKMLPENKGHYRWNRMCNTNNKNPAKQQATFSTFKKRNAIQFLVGTTPGGLVSYISEVYGGFTSDRQIVERSNLLHVCDRKDSIMTNVSMCKMFLPLETYE